MVLVLLTLALFFFLASVRVINQYERGVVLRLGHFEKIFAPGLNFVIPILDRVIKVDVRITTADIPQQEVITRDNVPVGINAVVYFQVERPDDAVLKIQDYTYAVTQYAQTALRDVIGGVELDTLLTGRQHLADEIKKIVDEETNSWGINVTSIKLQDIQLPADMKRSMAKQAEAERERRAVIIRAQGELTASENLAKAMEKLGITGAISLRTLQTIESTATNPANTVVFAIPIEIIKGLEKLGLKT